MKRANPNFHSSTGSALEQAVAKGQAAMEAAAGAAAVARAMPDTVVPMDQGMPFELLSLDLTGADPALGISTTQAVNYDRGGYGLYFRRRGSHAMASLIVRAGGVFQAFHPGDRIQGPFNNIEFLLNASTLPFGRAELVIEKRKDCHFAEAPIKRPQVDVLYDTAVAGVTGDQFSTLIDARAYDVIRAGLTGIAFVGGASPTTTLQLLDIVAGDPAITPYAFSIVTGLTGAQPALIEWGIGLPNAAILGSSTCLASGFRPEYVRAEVANPAGAPTSFGFRLRITGCIN